jgi:hypothetical protein
MMKFNFITYLRNKEPGKIFSMKTRLGAGLPENMGSLPDGSGDITTASTQTVERPCPVGIGYLSPGVKRLVCDTAHELPSSDEVQD